MKEIDNEDFLFVRSTLEIEDEGKREAANRARHSAVLARTPEIEDARVTRKQDLDGSVCWDVLPKEDDPAEWWERGGRTLGSPMLVERALREGLGFDGWPGSDPSMPWWDTSWEAGEVYQREIGARQ